MGVAVSGNYAYVACGWDGLQVIEVSDKSNPQKAAAVQTGGFARNLAVSGNLIYLACGVAGLVIVDVSDPVHPSKITGDAQINPGYVWDVAIADSRAYVAIGQSDTLQAYDISVPANPRLLGTYNARTGPAQAVAVTGTTAFLAMGSDGIEAVDISQPATMTRVGAWRGLSSCYGVATVGQWLYVANNQRGLRVLDAAAPTALSEVGAVDTPGSSWGVTVAGNIAFVADQTHGLQLIDVSSPTSPQLLGSVATGSWTYGVAVSGDFAYVADFGGNLTILELPPAITSIAMEGQSIRLNWHALGPAKLQRATTPHSTSWQDVSGCDGKTSMTLPLANGQEFFRVIR